MYITDFKNQVTEGRGGEGSVNFSIRVIWTASLIGLGRYYTHTNEQLSHDLPLTIQNLYFYIKIQLIMFLTLSIAKIIIIFVYCYIISTDYRMVACFFLDTCIFIIFT